MKKIVNKIGRFIFLFLIIIPAIPFIIGSIGFIVYAHWPRDISTVTNIQLRKDTQYITLSAHGVKDSSESWSNELQHLMSSSSYLQLKEVLQQNISLDWRPFSDSALICSVTAKNIGVEIGKKLAHGTSIQGIHAIGHSCGSFIVLGICEGAKSVNSDIKIQTTYLDPVSVYSGFIWNYGLNNFGTCGDFSDTYIDTKDTVPGSNQALPYSHTFDVTEVRTQNNIKSEPHAWPTKFYIEAYRSQKAPLLFNNKKGSITKQDMDELLGQSNLIKRMDTH